MRTDPQLVTEVTVIVCELYVLFHTNNENHFLVLAIVNASALIDFVVVRIEQVVVHKTTRLSRLVDASYSITRTSVFLSVGICSREGAEAILAIEAFDAVNHVVAM